MAAGEQANMQLGTTLERARLYDLLMQAPAIIAIVHGPRHVYTVANPRYMELVGAYRNIIGKTIRQALPELAGQGVYELLDHVYKTGETFTGKERLVSLKRSRPGKLEDVYVNLTYQPVCNDDGEVDGIFIYAVDVTEQVLARKRVEESEQRLRFMAESMPQMVFTIQPDGTVSYMSPQWERYSGLRLDKLQASKKLRNSIVHPTERNVSEAAWQRAFKAGKQLEYEYRLRRKDGVYRWHISRITPMKDKKGKITMWIGSTTDIDDVKRAAERRHELEIKTAALTEQRSQLMALNQAKDEFISLASHQLRTPATGVKQYLAMLLQGYAGDLTPGQEMFVQTAYESNERQIRIVNDLLQVARIDAGKVQLHRSSTDVVRLVKNVLNEQASKFAERQQTVYFVAKTPQLKASIDADRIRMALDNILDNACKYTEPGKSIRVSVRGTEKTVSLIVKDQGVGMGQADVETIFHKFSRLNNPLSAASEGSGLGLYWADKIVGLHQGTIKVKSVPGEGTTFTITLPR